MTNNNEIRQAIIHSIPPEPFNAGEPPPPEQMYLPLAHKKCLELYCNPVVGSRGVGKSTWTSALADDKLRSILGMNIPELNRTTVSVGFSAAPPRSHPSRQVIADIIKAGYSASEMWQAVIIRNIRNDVDVPVSQWMESVKWVRENQEEWAKRILSKNDELKQNNMHTLIVFDALDRTGDTWEGMDDIVRALLSLVIDLKGYSNIHTKVFLREDQYSRNIKDFPDASKLRSTETKLNWSLRDLNGLLWQLLCNCPENGGEIFRTIYQEVVGAEAKFNGTYFELSNQVKNDEDIQKALFIKLAGPWMGAGEKRGKTYTWVVSHLADGNMEASPRSFLMAIRHAAEDSIDKESKYPLYFRSIYTGVQEASRIRVGEINEDYPWVTPLCGLLSGTNVPLSFADIENIWRDKYPNGPKDLEPEFQDRLSSQIIEKGWQGIKEELVRIGVFRPMLDGRINMPDLYRVGFGLGRKGGVKPLREARMNTKG
jgi:hypothetical protein